MNMILVYPHEPDSAGCVRLDGERARHIRNVLRATVGKTLKIGRLNGPKGVGTVEALDDQTVVLRCEFNEILPLRPPVDLLLALPRPKVMKRLWAQLAALGVGRILLTNAEKVERYYFDSHVLEPDVYNELLIEGLQQAGDTLLPEVRVIRQLKPFLEDGLDTVFPRSGKRVLADPSGAQTIFHGLENSAAIVPEAGRILLAVGPEGGWTPYELALFSAHGFQMFNAGSRILRTDTACVALLALTHQTLTLAQV
jgi:RsmE family RNA methyltransferase